MELMTYNQETETTEKETGKETTVALPQVLVDSCQRPEGVVIVCGNRFSQIPQLLENLAAKMAGRKVAWLQKEQDLNPARDADLIFAMGPINIEKLLELSEEGRMVVQVVMAPSVVSAIHKVYSTIVGENKKHMLWRLVDQLVLIINQQTILDIKQNAIPLHEMILCSSEVKKRLLSADIETLESQLRHHHEDKGMVSLNQILLQHMIRRRVDLKTAFSKTRDPEGLDELLKRVGI